MSSRHATQQEGQIVHMTDVPGHGFLHQNFVAPSIAGENTPHHVHEMLNYSMNVVGGVMPGRCGKLVKGIHVFDMVKQVVEKTGALKAQNSLKVDVEMGSSWKTLGNMYTTCSEIRNTMWVPYAQQGL